MDLMGGSSQAEHTPLKYSANEVVSQINEALARWEAEARFPLQKPSSSSANLHATSSEIDRPQESQCTSSHAFLNFKLLLQFRI
ncbi:hypothetical protein PILCRDRAFT_821120 [Piloderma croceum F 1598]|uniref:Uncharacterized protein n=1 Tax=Piloderma croceum (strain F 1598) TaxID=765440 RepID=A0A0C3FRM3_PILCF|nr:hypothetical protein PILCRDRAFT_821120 [Piloderma croceum F 1598]